MVGLVLNSNVYCPFNGSQRDVNNMVRTYGYFVNINLSGQLEECLLLYRVKTKGMDEVSYC
jgi:hypothetical protein